MIKHQKQTTLPYVAVFIGTPSRFGLKVHVYLFGEVDFVIWVVSGELGVSRQHVVVHVDGATVLNGVAQTLGHHGAARVRR